MRPRYAHTPMPIKTCVPFGSGEEAWFWFIRCQVLRHQCARPARSITALSRPCDPDDIYRVVIALHKHRKLTAEHLRILSQYGLAERTPDERCVEENRASQLWVEAIGIIEERMIDKKIVCPPVNGPV